MFKSRNFHAPLMASASKPARKLDASPLFGFAGFAVALCICFAIGF